MFANLAASATPVEVKDEHEAYQVIKISPEEVNILTLSSTKGRIVFVNPLVLFRAKIWQWCTHPADNNNWVRTTML